MKKENYVIVRKLLFAFALIVIGCLTVACYSGKAHAAEYDANKHADISVAVTCQKIDEDGKMLYQILPYNSFVFHNEFDRLKESLKNNKLFFVQTIMVKTKGKTPTIQHRLCCGEKLDSSNKFLEIIQLITNESDYAEESRHNYTEEGYKLEDEWEDKGYTVIIFSK